MRRISTRSAAHAWVRRRGTTVLLALALGTALVSPVAAGAAGPAAVAVDPDGTAATAATIGIGIGSARSGTIDPEGDVDFYKFAATAGRTYTVELYNVAADLGTMYLHAYNAAGTTLTYTNGCNGSGNVCARLQLKPSIGGTYFLRVKPYRGEKSGTYAIRVLPRYDQGLTRGASGEPDDALALAAPLAVGTSGAPTRAIYPLGENYHTVGPDQDHYRFTAVAGRTYTAELYDVASDLGTMYFHAYNAAGTTLTYTNGCNTKGGVCARLKFTPSIGGTFFLRAKPYSGDKSGTYKIRVTGS